MNEEENKRSYEWLAEIVKVSVLSWSAALLTLSYMGYFQKMDPTFIASIFSGSLAGYGISRASDANRKQKDTKVEVNNSAKIKRCKHHSAAIAVMPTWESLCAVWSLIYLYRAICYWTCRSRLRVCNDSCPVVLSVGDATPKKYYWENTLNEVVVEVVSIVRSMSWVSITPAAREVISSCQFSAPEVIE